MKKILLINPPYYVSKKKINFWPSFPLGMGYLASYLEKNGYLLNVIDAFGEGYELRTAFDKTLFRIGLTEGEIVSRIKEFSPDLIGISNLFSSQHFSLHAMAKLVKSIDKDIPIVVGGPHVSAVPELVLKDTNIDFAVLGEGEHTLKELITVIGKRDGYNKIPGISYRLNGEVVVNRGSNFINNLDEIPFPAWHLFKMQKYLFQEISHGGEVKKQPFMTMVTSRGCPFNCFFCSVRDTWGKNIRFRSSKNVIEEITVLKTKFDVKEIIFVDDNFNFDLERLDTILEEIINRKLDIAFEVPNGLFIQKLNKKVLSKLKLAGFSRIYFPIESGNEQVRNKIIRKPIDISLLKELIQYCKKIKLDILGYFIIGLPQESKAQMRDTFRLVRELKIKHYFSIATPFPGSDLYKFAKEKGLLKSYEIDSCAEEYNINTSDWSSKELKRFIKFELFKIDCKTIIISFLFKPFRLFNRIMKKIFLKYGRTKNKK